MQKNYYYRKKAELRAEAKAFQIDNAQNNYSWWEIADYQQYLTDEAKKYGLIKEFKENAII